MHHFSLSRFPAWLGAAAVLLCLLAPARTASAQTTITTITDSYNSGFGTYAPVIGQTFIAPDDNVLTSFAVQLYNAEDLTLSIFVYDPATNTTVGAPLFTSAPTAPTTVSERLNIYIFPTGGLSLTTGQVYVALVSGAVQGYGGPFLFDPYTGGEFILGGNLTGPFGSFFGGLFSADLAFTATFEAQATPEARISALIATVRGLELPKGIENSFVVKLEAALFALEAGNTASAIDSLQAFINHAQALSGKKLPAVQAQALIEEAAAIQAQLGGA